MLITMPQRIESLTAWSSEKAKLGKAEDFSGAQLWSGDTDLVSLRSTLLFGIKGWRLRLACLLRQAG